MPAVKISEDHNGILEDEQSRMEEDVGITPEKKQLVEKAIEELYI